MLQKIPADEVKAKEALLPIVNAVEEQVTKAAQNADSRLAPERTEQLRQLVEIVENDLTKLRDRLEIGRPTPLDLPDIPPPAPVKKTPPLAQVEQRVHATWSRAEQIAHSKRGAYPFTQAGKEALLKALADARRDVRQLVDGGRWTEAEGELASTELYLLTERVSAFRAIESKGSTCYKPTNLKPSTCDIRARLHLARRVAADEVLHPKVLRKLIASLKEDVAFLEAQAPSMAASADGAAVLDETRVELEALEQRLSRPPVP